MTSIWMQLDASETETIRKALQELPEDGAKSILSKIEILTTDREHDEAFRQAAADVYAGKLQDGDVDFQHDGLVSYGEEGAYVMAFLYVRNEDVFPEMDKDHNDDSPAP